MLVDGKHPIRPGAAALVALVLIGTGACSSGSEHGSVRRTMTDVRFAERQLKKVSISIVYRDAKRIGTVEEFRELDDDSNDANDRHFWFVVDETGHRLGYVTDDHRAYRFDTHGAPSELVANHTDLGPNVLAVFGWFDGKVTIERQVAAD